MKRRLFLTVLLLCTTLTGIFGLSSCKTTGPDSPSTEAPEQIALAGNGVSAYTLVRGDSVSQDYIDLTVRLRKGITQATGVELELTTDFVGRGEQVPTGTKEILVGPTNRPESQEAIASLGKNEYYIGMKNDRLVITGSNELSTKKAVQFFMQEYLGFNSEDNTYSKTELTVPAGLNDKKTFELSYTVYIIENSLYQNCGFTEGDITRFYSCLQGLINRNSKENHQMVYLNYDMSDEFWYDYITEDGRFMADSEEIRLTDIAQLWEYFMPFIKEHGLILWDEAVPATANAAATICGLDGYLPVRYDTAPESLYTYLTEQGVEVKQNLVGMFTGKGTLPDSSTASSGSPKNDVYLWAMEKYMDRCNPGYLAYILDGYPFVGNPNATARDNMVYSMDYMVMKQMFFFDLYYSSTEAPTDEPDQKPGTDKKTLTRLLQKASKRNGGETIQLIGFPFWWIKYSNYCDPNCGWAPSQSEWAFAGFVSKYNVTMEADAAGQQYMTNASVYTWYPLKEKYENNHRKQDLTFDPKVRYFTIYMGDYDSAAWMKYHLVNLWQDQARGDLPLMWGFNPNLSERCPMTWEWVMTTMTENDYILTGDSGAGYLFPSQLRTQDAMDKWVAYSKKKMAQFDIDMVAFLIDGYEMMNEKVMQMYSQLAPNGIFYNSDTHSSKKIFKKDNFYAMPCQTGLGISTTEDCYNGLMGVFNTMNLNFAAGRTVLESPSTIKAFVNGFTEYANNKDGTYTYMYVDPYTMMDLIAQSKQTKRLG